MRRREALFLAAAGPTIARSQQLAGEPPGRIPPAAEIINASEMEAIARRRLDSAAYTAIADTGADRAAFDRITLRPRLMVSATNLDLGANLFGQPLFAPILAGPAGGQNRFHPEGELAMARGASKAKAVLIVSERSSVPLEKIAAESPGFWYQVFPEAGTTRAKIDLAVKAGCKAVCLTAGAGGTLHWAAIEGMRKDLAVPLLLKGVMSPDDARAAADHGLQGIVVSSYRGVPVPGMASPIETLPAIAEAAGSRLAVLIDGGFRRGSDVLKAIALGARAVIVTRPALWGLAAYGAAGVQQVLELLQSELARDMAMCGKPNLAAIDRATVRLHRR